jgi:hypothetical protein
MWAVARWLSMDIGFVMAITQQKQDGRTPKHPD